MRIPENVKKEKEIFSDSDIAKLEADGSDAAKIVLMLVYTGMRIGELFALPVEDCHETYVVGGEKTDAGRNRVIPIRPEGRGYFRYFAQQADGPLLLSGYAGERIPNNFPQAGLLPSAGQAWHRAKDPARHPAHLRQPRQEERHAAGDSSENSGPRRLQHYGKYLHTYGRGRAGEGGRGPLICL